MSIRIKVLISMFTSFFILIILLSGYMYSKFEAVITERVKSDVKSVMLENKQSFDSIVRGIGRCFVSVSDNEFITETLLEASDSSVEISKNKIRFNNEYKNIFELSVGSMINEYVLHFYVNKDIPVSKAFGETNVNSFYNTDYGVYSTQKNENEIWYQETLKSDAPWYIFRNSANEDYIYFSKKIISQTANNINYGKFLGVSVIGIDCSQLLNQMQLLAVTDDISIAVLDSENNVISKSSDALLDGFIKEIADDNPVGFEMNNFFETEDYVINAVKCDAGITFISFVLTKSIYLKAADIRNIVLIGLVIVLLIAFFILFILSYYLTKPIKQLSGSMAKIDYENLKADGVKIKSGDEVGELYKAFSMMMEKIEKSIERENEQNEKTRKLEIQMLQAQINPHFLYNVLDSISWLAMENEQEKIGEMADLLSQIFSYSIKDGNITATLREELETVKKYVCLQKNRYTENICLDISAEEECLGIVIPKCILQPIVENSIVHGLSDEAEGINIVIRAEVCGNFLKISVSDDGKGCDVNVLNGILSGNREIKYHMGIKNVATRILETYGPGCRIEYVQNENGGVCANITLSTKIAE